ncbi:Exodeoxyribonuclease VII large subunit [Magnetococcus marinus MC-1]|uniref:Exodeoxyribonuclease 7 large subunit n=1 Tax=Magnetococcus marinus (strain ATCC BAA-1437 / JCM 17883 / MC-1) TaxID=156889 RepID=A0L6H7_MAGMM|nr:exodeoxyribonuclease VII large subunit [Magnetococcus marinus]ABK43570.1 Exodeoxyribonuclease VII large subunit [Magnetococcus marinus MC-1]
MYSNDTPSWKKVLSVFELNSAIRDLLEEGFAFVRVQGEVSRISAPASGHLYFNLVDEQAQIRAVVWRASKARLSHHPREGEEVLITGRISVFAPRGEYQIIVDALTPKGAGSEREKLLQLHRQLEQEGLFDPQRKRPLPYLPHVIGVATSESGAALQDIIRVLESRNPDFHLLLAPCQVQGSEAPQAIVQALRALNADGRAQVIICGRGGGSAEDLACFNSEQVVRAIAASAIPVVSAVGHEVDTTLADLAADLRAATPSQAAELIMPERLALAQETTALALRLQRAMHQQLHNQQRRVQQASQRLLHPSRRLDQARLRCDELQMRLQGVLERLLPQQQQRLRRATNTLHHWATGPSLPRQRQQLKQQQHRAHTAMLYQLRQWQSRLHSAQLQLIALSPLQVLERGYAIVRDNQGSVLRDAQAAPLESTLTITLAKGTLAARVTQRKP